MKIILISSLLLFCSTIINAQNLRILEKNSLEAISGVLISNENNSINLRSNNKGIVDISSLKDEESYLIQKAGYTSIKRSKQALSQNNYTVYLSEKVYNIDEVVISASKFEEKISDVPQQMQVINSRSIKFANQANTAELLQNSGNVMVQKSQAGGGSPIVRGFEANKVLLVVDGVRMNNAIYRGGHLQNVLTLDNAILDKTEIVFGPGSVVYGSDALGGVLHFYTKNPTISTDEKTAIAVNLLSRYSSAFDEKTGHFDVNIGFKKVALLSSFTFGDFGDLRQGNLRSPFTPDFGKRNFFVQNINGQDSAFVNKDFNIQKQSGYQQYDFMQKVLFQASDKVSHLLNFQYSGTGNIPRYDRLAELRNGKPRFAEWYYGPQNRLMAAYTLSLKKTNRYYDNARFIASFQNLLESRHDRNFQNATRNNREETVKVFTINSDFEKLIGKNELRYGFEVSHNQVTSKAFSNNILTNEIKAISTRYPSRGSSMTNLGIYATHTLELNEKLILSDGLRLSSVNLSADFSDKQFFPLPIDQLSQNNTALNGNLGLVYLPGKDWRISSMLSTGFRAPNIDDLSKVFDSVKGDTLGGKSTIGTVIVPNPNLKPEYTYNAEITVAKTFDKRIQISTTAFYTLYQNTISTQNASFNGETFIPFGDTLARVQQNINNASAFIYGVSANLKADVSDNFSIISSINYTYGRIKTDSSDYPLDHIPPVFGQTSFKLNVQQFSAEFFVRYSGWKRLQDYNLVGEDNYAQATVQGMPAWCTLNLRAAYQVNQRLRAQLALENLLDQNYRVFASGISAPGRNLIVSLRASF